MPRAWSEFSAQLGSLPLGEERELVLMELAAWLEQQPTDAASDRAASGEAEPLALAARSLAADPGWNPGLKERVRYFNLAGDLWAQLDERQDAAAAMGLQAAQLLAAARRLPEASALAEETLGRFAGADWMRPQLLLSLAEWSREVGSLGLALARLEEAELALAAAPGLGEALLLRLPMIRAQTFLDLGLPDRAASSVQEALQRAELLYRASPSDAESLRLAQRLRVHLAKATGDHLGVTQLVAGYLADDVLYGPVAKQRAELRCIARTSALWVDTGLPLEERARALRASLGTELGARLQAFARMALAEAYLARADHQAAAEELREARTQLDRWAERDAQRAPLEDLAHLQSLELRLALDRGADVATLRTHLEPMQAALDGLLERWDEVPDLPGGAGFLLYGQRRRVLGEFLRLLLALDPVAGPGQAFEVLLRVQAQGTLARRDRAPVPELELVQRELLDERGGLLVYLPVTGVSHLFVLDGEGLAHAPLVSFEELGESCRDYLAHLSASRQSLPDESLRALLLREERRLARQLSEQLLPEALRRRVQGWSQLTVVGCDSLGPVPFAWLPLLDEPHLGLARALSFLPSIPLGVLHRQRAVPAELPLDWLLLGGVTPSEALEQRWPELGALPLPEAAELGSYGPGRSLVLSGAEATLAKLEAARPERARVFQFLGHGVSDGSRERPSSLVLGADGEHDGLLHCEDVGRLASAQVVLLTACASGQGPQRRGDPGMGDMGGAWLSAGARAVVLARTDLSLAQAQAASSSLHRAMLEQGASPAEGLRQARVELVARHGASAPFEGGLLHVVGLGHESPFEGLPGRGEPRAAWPWGFALGALGLVVVAGTLWRRRAA